MSAPVIKLQPTYEQLALLTMAGFDTPQDAMDELIYRAAEYVSNTIGDAFNAPPMAKRKRKYTKRKAKA